MTLTSSSPDELYREDAQQTKFVADRTLEYINFALEKGDYIRQESPGVLQIRVLKPKKEKKS
jgi:hypothetical protein